MPDADNSDQLTAEEELLLKKHLSFYQSLARGNRIPRTEAQKHFAQVFCGRAPAETIHEKAYLKYLRLRASDERPANSARGHDPADGPTQEWFTREDWHKVRGRRLRDTGGTEG